MNGILRISIAVAAALALLSACAQSSNQEPDPEGFYPVRVWVMDFQGDHVRVSLGDKVVFNREYAEDAHDYAIDEIYFSDPGPVDVVVDHEGNIEEAVISLNDDCNQLIVSSLQEPMIRYTDHCGPLID